MNEQEPTADPRVRRAARAAARRLAHEVSPSLPAQVEDVLAARGGDRPPDHFAIDVVALGSLVVSAASLAWTVVNDRRKEGAKPSREAVARQVLLELELPGDDGVTVEQRVRIIDIVVEEFVDGDE